MGTYKTTRKLISTEVFFSILHFSNTSVAVK